MSDEPFSKAKPRREPPAQQLIGANLYDALKFAVRDSGVMNPAVQKVLGQAMMMPDQSTANDLVARLRQGGVSAEDLIDFYLPAVARDYGDDWCQDEMSFAEVTIGCARLQSWMRDLDSSLDLAPPAFDAPGILLVVQPEAYHSLGAMVALSQFRRLGASVRLALGPSLDTLAGWVRDGVFDMVALTASSSERLEKLRLMIERIRQAADPAPPIVIGGSLLDTEPDVKILTGADFITSSPQEALELCGLKTEGRAVQSSSLGRKP